MTLILIAVAAGLFQTAASTAAEPVSPMSYFQGRWRCDEYFTPSNRPLSSTLEFGMDPVTGATTKAHRDLPPGTFAANETWAVDRDGVFRLSMADRFSGMRWYTSNGWSDDRWVWERRPVGEEVREQFIYARQDADRMTFEWWIERDEAGLPMGDTLTCLRE